jgi:hypothetical protein
MERASAVNTRGNEFIAEHGLAEYANWHLGVDDAVPEDTKAHLHGMIEAHQKAARVTR